MPNIIYKEIEQLSKKSTISGTEKIVVSDTEFVTPSQIAGLVNISGKQDTLVSGENIKTINNQSILGPGNIETESGSPVWGDITGSLANQTDLKQALDVLDSGIGQIGEEVGDLSDLDTTDKSSIVNAINEAMQSGGGNGDVSIEDSRDGTDLNIVDKDYNILVQFKNGHIRTKMFDSENGVSSNGLKVLFFGNSLTQDAVSCLPLLLKEIAPEMNFTIYIWYNGGLTLKSQYEDYLLSPNQTCGIFSTYKSSDSKWKNENNMRSINWVIANCDFDLLVLQEYGNAGQTDAQIKTSFTNVENWFFNNYQKPLKVVSMMDAAARNDLSNTTTRIEHYSQVFFGQCASQGIIPAGRAISYACETELNSLGDGGGLSQDGIHAQEGLPCLLQSYVIAMWIFGQLGINKSIWGSQTRITQEVYTQLNVPGANLGTGVITGTEAQHLIAQECAIKAIKRGRGLEIETLIG